MREARSNPKPRSLPFLPGLAVVLLAGALAAPAGSSGAVQTEVEPGFNVFSVEQDVEIGRRSAEEVEARFPVLDDRSVESYIDRLGERLAGRAPGPDFPYTFEVLNLSDVNAFALPGGPVHLNRGLVELAGSEAELAGVMAHEIGHIALRHGTNRASKAYLGNAGMGLLQQFLGGGATETIVGAVGGFGLNALFLDFSRDDERDADILGAQIMARAGYDPMDMVAMFRRMRRHSGGGGNAPIEFFSSHPPYDDRVARVREEARLIGSVERRGPVGGFASVRNELRGMSPAPSAERFVDEG